MSVANFKDHHQFRRMFWRIEDGSKTSCQEQDVTHVEIETRYSCYRHSFTFTWPAEEVKVWELTTMLNTAFECGKGAAQADMRASLGL